jgi:hypothetical protein
MQVSVRAAPPHPTAFITRITVPNLRPHLLFSPQHQPIHGLLVVSHLTSTVLSRMSWSEKMTGTTRSGSRVSTPTPRKEALRSRRTQVSFSQPLIPADKLTCADDEYGHTSPDIEVDEPVVTPEVLEQRKKDEEALKLKRHHNPDDPSQIPLVNYSEIRRSIGSGRTLRLANVQLRCTVPSSNSQSSTLSRARCIRLWVKSF